MHDRGKLKWFLGIDFKMGQERYVDSILNCFKITSFNLVSTLADKSIQLKRATDEEYQAFLSTEVVGGFIYLMTATRLDVNWTTSKLSQYLDKPSQARANATKRLL